MAATIYNSAVNDVANGDIDFGSDTFYGMLVTSSYSPNKDTDNRRDDVTNECSGTGYTAGGAATAATVTLDTANDRVDVTFADITWAASTITGAHAIVIYKHRGGASSADNLVAHCPFPADKSSVAQDLKVSFTSPFRFQN